MVSSISTLQIKQLAQFQTIRTQMNKRFLQLTAARPDQIERQTAELDINHNKRT